jgi:hypothetical protein
MIKTKSKKQTAPDFLLEASKFFLSDFPQEWNGKKILRYIEFNPDDYQEQILPWLPFEDYDGETLAEYIEQLAEKYEYFFNLKK